MNEGASGGRSQITQLAIKFGGNENEKDIFLLYGKFINFLFFYINYNYRAVHRY